MCITPIATHDPQVVAFIFRLLSLRTRCKVEAYSYPPYGLHHLGARGHLYYAYTPIHLHSGSKYSRH